MTYGSLFSGIGGFDLGLDRAGMECRWQVEIDDFCRRVLEKHWPKVKRYGDIRQITGAELEPVDLICGGFPCQPVSLAGEMLAQADERWLWPEFARIIRAVGPRFVLVENVPGLLVRGMGDVLGDLAGLGYDAEWSVLSACAMGAPHTRDRVFVVAHPQQAKWWPLDSKECEVAGQECVYARRPEDPGGLGIHRPTEGRPWTIEPRPVGVASRVPGRMDRLSGLGNAVVPQVAQYVAERILEADARLRQM